MKTIRPTLGAQLGKYRLKRGLGGLVGAYLKRPYTSRSSRKITCYYNSNSISFSQVYPFIYYEKQIRENYNCEIRYYPIETLLNGSRPTSRDIDAAFVQPWFDVSEARLEHALESLKNENPKITISFLDSFAHNDLRLARTLDPYVSNYVKKSLFVQREDFLRPFKGDTNLTEYYSGIYGLEANLSDWKIPSSILPKLRLCPNFFTAPHLIEKFRATDFPPNANRGIDVHVRLGAKGSDWYQMMRNSCNSILMDIDDLSIISGSGISFQSFINELRNSKLCISPFGYGELCWRDIEAFMTGSVLVKPDMSHLETLPQLYEANVTYLPVKWDFSNMEEVIRTALNDDLSRERIAYEAFNRIRRYLNDRRFPDDMGYLFR